MGLAQDRKTIMGSIHSNGALHIDKIGFSNKQLTGNFAGHYFWMLKTCGNSMNKCFL